MNPRLLAAIDPTSLDNLVDIVVPEPAPGWPPAPGWMVLAGALGLAIVWWTRRSWRSWRTNAYRREALRLLDEIDRDGESHPQRLHELPELLKRTALAAYPRETVAGLSGMEWLRFLDRTAKSTEFVEGPGRRLPDLAYDPAASAKLGVSERRGLIEAARHWIAHHQASPIGTDGRTTC